MQSCSPPGIEFETTDKPSALDTQGENTLFLHLEEHFTTQICFCLIPPTTHMQKLLGFSGFFIYFFQSWNLIIKFNINLLSFSF